MWIVLGLSVMVLFPLVSLFLFLWGLGGIFNTVSKAEYEEVDDA